MLWELDWPGHNVYNYFSDKNNKTNSNSPLAVESSAAALRPRERKSHPAEPIHCLSVARASSPQYPRSAMPLIRPRRTSSSTYRNHQHHRGD